MGMSLILMLMVTLVLATTRGHAMAKRSAAGSGPGAFDYPDYPAVKYDEYPVVVPKRAALLLDRLMVALQKAVDDQNTGGSSSRNLARSAPQQQLVNSQIVPAADEQTPPHVLVREEINLETVLVSGEDLRLDYYFSKKTEIQELRQAICSAKILHPLIMDLQRRGQAKGRVYWRCYFNAVTCFKRK